MVNFRTTTRSPDKLLIFARVPEPGAVKTRLAATLGDERALDLYRAMLEDLFHGLGKPDDRLDMEVVWSGGEAVPGEQIREAFGGHRLTRQSGRNLGERLVVAFSEKIAFHEARKIVVIGTDLPTLSREVIETSMELLDSCDWVVGPAMDGGYYLLGCRAGSFHPLVFEKIEWGGPDVLEDTLSRIRDLGTSVAILPERFDLDLPSDLERFAALPEAEGTRLKALLETWST